MLREVFLMKKNIQWKSLVYNSMYENEFLNLKKKDLYPLVERLSRMAINRRNKFKDFYAKNQIPLPIAYKDTILKTRRGKKAEVSSYLEADFNVSRHMNIDTLRHKFKLLRGYLRTKTSTAKGWEKTIDTIADKLIYSTISKYKTVNGVNIAKTKKELDNELAQKRIDFENRFKENVGREYYDDAKEEQSDFYTVMWRVYNRVVESGRVQDNMQSGTIKIVYDLMESKGQSSVSELYNEVIQILDRQRSQKVDEENRLLKAKIEDAGMDTNLFTDIGSNS